MATKQKGKAMPTPEHEAFLKALKRCREIDKELIGRRQACLNELLRKHGVLKIKVEPTRFGHHVLWWLIILGNGKRIVVASSVWGGHVTDNLGDFDPVIDKLERERKALNKKYRLFA